MFIVYLPAGIPSLFLTENGADKFISEHGGEKSKLAAIPRENFPAGGNIVGYCVKDEYERFTLILEYSKAMLYATRNRGTLMYLIHDLGN